MKNTDIDNGDALPQTASGPLLTRSPRSFRVVPRESDEVQLNEGGWISNLVPNTLPVQNEINYDVVYQSCVPARDSLLAMANKYRQKLKLPALSVDARHNWADLDVELQSACSAMETVAARDKDFSGSVGKLRRAFRMLCQQAGCGNTFVSLIPNDAFGFSSILCGGLTVIFTGLQQTALYRDEVYRTLEDLPYILTDHSTPLNLFVCGDDEDLHRRTALLYISVFKLLEHLLGWFVKNTFVTKMKVLVDPKGFSEKLREKIAEVKLRAQRWERRALRLSMQSQNEALQLQYQNSFAQVRIDRNMQMILNRTEDLEDRLSRSKILESLDSFLHVIVSTLDRRLDPSEPTRQAKLLPNAGTKAAEILERFLYEPELIPCDCATVLGVLKRDRRGRSDLNGTRVVALQTNPRIQAWLTMDESSLLLVNGRTKSHPRSEMSVVSAQIVHRLLDVERATAPIGEVGSATLVPLTFFCGQHRDAHRDPNGNPAEVAMSLLLQLVDHVGASVPGDVLRKCQTGTRPLDIASICASLERVLSSLSNKVIVVLVVDGIKFFTHPTERRDQTRELVERLVAIYRKRTRATLKVLFASPARSEFLEDLFEDDEILSLPRDLPWSAIDGLGCRDRLQLQLLTSESGDEGLESAVSRDDSDNAGSQGDEEHSS